MSALVRVACQPRAAFVLAFGGVCFRGESRTIVVITVASAFGYGGDHRGKAYPYLLHAWHL